MQKIKGKKADAVVFLVIIFGIFFVGLYFVVMSQAHDIVYSTINNSAGGFDPRVEKTNSRLNSIWTWLPILILMGFIVWAVVNSARAKENAGY
jgi:heme/copper-type cytochrome/quinol oxidase subunit 2